MTWERAIVFFESRVCNIGYTKDYRDACRIATAAIREKQKRCHGCSSCNGGFGDNTIEFEVKGYNFCPVCGRELKVGDPDGS